ncbi:hypothetical protein [Chryseobacterium sp. Leaf394]|uniref:hypothetical protein n=1 Tax=Chryseobacterium sp. Leaf394 TaxID=1736361 RepID=UPI000FF877E2|nr:hypothetical protein [Chryseobacterium sp. Leaf394]
MANSLCLPMVFTVKRFPFWAMLFFVFSLFGTKLNAQVDFGTGKPEQVGIFLKGNASVHSSDELFNAQVASQKIEIHNDQQSLLSIKKIGSKLIIKNQSKKITFAEEAKIAQKKKLEEVKKSVDKKINATISKVKYNLEDNIKTHSSEQFAHLGGSLKPNFIKPSPTQDFQKTISEKQYLILIRTFNYLQEKKIFDYNSQSKKFGFTKVLSVRPPPVLC